MELSLGISSAKAAWDVLNLAVKARDAAQIEAATLDLRTKLFAMSDTSMAYVEKNALLTTENATLKLDQVRLKEEIARLEEEAREDQKYALHEFATGTLALKYDPSMDTPAKPVHYLCLACKNDGRKSVLQPSGKYGTALICQTNKEHHIAIQASTPQPVGPRRVVMSRGIDRSSW